MSVLYIRDENGKHTEFEAVDPMVVSSSTPGNATISAT